MRRARVSLLSWCLVLVGHVVYAQTPQAPAAPPQARRVITPQGVLVAGSYSPGVQAGQRLFLSGQLGRDPATGDLRTGVAEQTRQAMENIGAVSASCRPRCARRS